MRKFWRQNTPAEDPAVPAPAPSTPAAPGPRPHLASWRAGLVILLSLANAGLSGLLLLQHYGEPRAAAAVSQACGEGQDSGCAAVAKSRYSAVRGLPLAAVGLAFSLSVALLLLIALVAGPHTRSAAGAFVLIALAVALAADLVLFGVQLLLVKAFCRLCLLTYLVNGLSLALLLPVRRDGSVLGEALGRVEGRVAFTGALLGVLAVGGAVLTATVALRSREAVRASKVLGVPMEVPVVRPSLPPAAPGSDAQQYQEEARLAQEQARRLQEILDDERKREEYLAQKAAREFDQGPVQSLDLKGTPFKGPAEAPIRVVEFSDFLCPFCRSIAGAFGAYVPQSANRVAVYFKNYPLDQACNPEMKQTVHPGACWLALGGICANQQGRFWPYHDRVFSAPPPAPQPKDVVALATAAGLETAGFEACLGAEETRARLAAEIAEAKKARVEATPTLFINGRKLPRTSDFVQTVEREAGRLGLPPLPQGQAPPH